MKNSSFAPCLAGLADVYKLAKREVTSRGYCDEIAWQASQNFEDMSESVLLKETAWVILCSGFKESVIRNKFSYLSLCFCDWQSAKDIVACKQACRDTALKSFGHKGKIDAILQTAELIDKKGFAKLKQEIYKSPLESLKQFPYIGDITAWHLAKNLGVPVAKPDRHLVRLANIMGYHDVQHFCGDVAEVSGDAIQVVDIVFWRFATLVDDLSAFINTSKLVDAGSCTEIRYDYA
jgi:hypothetical protein